MSTADTERRDAEGHDGHHLARNHVTGELGDRLRVPYDDDGVTLEAYDPGATPGMSDRDKAEHALVDDLRPRLEKLHDLLIANSDRSLLLVLQGLDGSGKSGTVRHVLSAMDPSGLRVTSFTEPTPKERAEPFLARIRRCLPDPGWVVAFDRSHYEDAIVPRANGEADDAAFGRTIRAITKFERSIVERGTVVVKCLLHLSYEEQANRFLRRLERPDKQWKFSESDVETRRRWPQFQAAYGETVGRTSIDEAPWHLIPADHKWYRNWAIATLLVEALERLDQRYPGLDVDVDVEALRARLTSVAP
jgi:PPK2 family polyphosphate:nucleotide phosphotransferase